MELRIFELGDKFQLKLTILVFLIKFAKRGISSWKLKEWTAPFNFGYLISLGTKFQLKLTILGFWAKFAKKGYLRSKKEKLNTTIRLWIFKLD